MTAQRSLPRTSEKPSRKAPPAVSGPPVTPAGRFCPLPTLRANSGLRLTPLSSRQRGKPPETSSAAGALERWGQPRACVLRSCLFPFH